MNDSRIFGRKLVEQGIRGQPNSELNVTNQVLALLDNLYVLVEMLDDNTVNANQKQIAKIVISKLPKKLEIRKEIVNTHPEIKDLEELKKLLCQENGT
eukprot:snap_masked-scaffold_2-processed-gene-22.11-mRNA-1 protein AED:1.00 eAED:1.00 QI:0/0/0/0/1/1/2/0/97